MIAPDILKLLLFGVFAALVVQAAVRDLVSYLIPNWIPVALVAAFVPAAIASHVSLNEALIAVAIGVGLLVIGVAMFALRWMGGGDAKLMAAAGLWLGLSGLGPFVAYTSLAGGGLALILLAMRSAWLRPFAAGGPSWVGRLAAPGGAAPYGVAIAIGALAAFPQGVLIRAAHGGF
jgi:prepilin peptidase CpaA